MPITKSLSTAISDGVGNYSFRNRIINGDMRIDQRNAGASLTNSTGLIYTLDRWINQTVGANCTIQRVTGSTGNQYGIRVTGTGAGNLTTLLQQRIEDVNIYDLASKTVTLSFVAYGSTSGSISTRFLYPTATNNYTSFTEPVAGTTINFTTTPTLYTVTRTLDSNADKGLSVIFDRGATVSGVSWTLENVQLEAGSAATPFERRPYGTELALCQRYYLKLSGSSTTSYELFGYWDGSNYAFVGYNHPVAMRVPAAGLTIAYSSLSDFAINNSGVGNPVPNAMSLNRTNGLVSSIYVAVASGGSSGGKAARLYTTTNPAYIEFLGAEL
jgi:hypothetical protein